jgi:archaeosine-15-forming tRNA-guanine transglycosylase
MCTEAPDRGVYAHYTRQGERVWTEYVTRNLSGLKCGTETTVTAVTDHLSGVLHIALNVTTVRRGRSYCKMNAVLPEALEALERKGKLTLT